MTMVSAHYALKALYREFGAYLLKQAIDSFETIDRVREETPTDKRLAYVKGSDFVAM